MWYRYRHWSTIKLCIACVYTIFTLAHRLIQLYWPLPNENSHDTWFARTRKIRAKRLNTASERMTAHRTTKHEKERMKTKSVHGERIQRQT